MGKNRGTEIRRENWSEIGRESGRVNRRESGRVLGSDRQTKPLPHC